jgi:uncharacterized protein
MNPLHELIRRLTPGVEFLIVITWAFGQAIFASILSIGDPEILNSKEYFNDVSLITVLVFETVQMVFLAWFLKVRGWTLEKLGLRITWRGTVVGLILLGILIGNDLFVGWLIEVLPADMSMAINRYPKPDPNLSMSLVFLASVVNGVFEEVFVAGYVIASLAPVRGLWTAINVSTGIRLLYHLYLGPVAFLVVVPTGLLFGYVFARTRALWPLILAHILIDILALSLGASGDSP